MHRPAYHVDPGHLLPAVQRRRRRLEGIAGDRFATLGCRLRALRDAANLRGSLEDRFLPGPPHRGASVELDALWLLEDRLTDQATAEAGAGTAPT